MALNSFVVELGKCTHPVRAHTKILLMFCFISTYETPYQVRVKTHR